MKVKLLSLLVVANICVCFVQKLDPGDLTARLALKQKAVHNMTWFFDNVYPELAIPMKHGMAFGDVSSFWHWFIVTEK